MPDAKDFAPNNPVYQKESPQPKYKTLSFEGNLEDDKEDWIDYAFTGDYFEFDRTISFVKATVTAIYTDPIIIPQDELQNILRIDIREELNTDYSIIFETQIELK
jgi:hypothetical protein